MATCETCVIPPDPPLPPLPPELPPEPDEPLPELPAELAPPPQPDARHNVKLITASNPARFNRGNAGNDILCTSVIEMQVSPLWLSRQRSRKRENLLYNFRRSNEAA